VAIFIYFAATLPNKTDFVKPPARRRLDGAKSSKDFVQHLGLMAIVDV
jgi:hypothetical protein